MFIHKSDSVTSDYFKGEKIAKVTSVLLKSSQQLGWLTQDLHKISLIKSNMALKALPLAVELPIVGGFWTGRLIIFWRGGVWSLTPQNWQQNDLYTGSINWN